MASRGSCYCTPRPRGTSLLFWNLSAAVLTGRGRLYSTWCEVKDFSLVLSLEWTLVLWSVLVVTSRAPEQRCSEEKDFQKIDLSAGRGGCWEKPAQGCLSYACVTVSLSHSCICQWTVKEPSLKAESRTRRHLETFISEQTHKWIYPTGIFCKKCEESHFPYSITRGFGLFSALSRVSCKESSELSEWGVRHSHERFGLWLG